MSDTDSVSSLSSSLSSSVGSIPNVDEVSLNPYTKYNTNQDSCSSWMWIVGLIILVMILGLAYSWYNSDCDNDIDDTGDEESNVSESVVGGKHSGKVHDLSVAELNKLSQNKKIVVIFVADGCGHCQSLKPALHLAASHSKVPLYTLNAKTPGATKVMQEMGIQGFPTIAKVHKGKIVEQHSGSRHQDDIRRFAEKK